MSLPGALGPNGSTDFVQQEQLHIVLAVEPLIPTAKEDPQPQPHLDSIDLSQKEVLNFDLQTEPTTSPQELHDQPSTNVSVGETQQTPTINPSKTTTNQPPATNYTTSLPQDHSLHDTIDPNAVDTAEHIISITNNFNDTENNNDIKALRLRLDSEAYQTLNRWQPKGSAVSRSTVSVDRSFGTVPRNFGRRFGGSEDRDIPPHPLNTYQWEDVRRSREKVIGMTNYMYKCCAVCFFAFHFSCIHFKNVLNFWFCVVEFLFIRVAILGRTWTHYR